MKTEIGGTFKWSEEQIKAYAAAFREGDAVKVDGEGWVEVTSRKDPHGDYLKAGELNDFKLSVDGVGVYRGFISPKGRYLVSIPKDYEVQEGDKLVWLGEGYSHWVFGRSYAVEVGSCGGLVVFDEDGLERLPKSENWGVIPRYENVKGENSMDSKDEHFGKVETFKKGDRVKVVGTSGGYEGHEGTVGIFDDTGGEPSCAVFFGKGRSKWFSSEFLELVEEGEKSVEQEAFEYLLSQDRDTTRSILQGEISIWANVHLEHRDYDDLRQVIDILEKLEESE